MKPLTHITRHDESLAAFSKEKLWALFDGEKSALNIAHECVDRHDPARIAINIINGDALASATDDGSNNSPNTGKDESYTFAELSEWSNRFANYLREEEIAPGDRVAIMLEPSLVFYAALFGAMKAGCVAVPLFTLFGPEGIALRLDDCAPSLFIAADQHVKAAGDRGTCVVETADDKFVQNLATYDSAFTASTSADDMAMYQYTSGTTRQLPDAIKHRHRAIVTVMIAALYGTGVRPEDNFCCPSSPAWGHGLWHGTLAPLGLGATITSYKGRFHPQRLIDSLDKYKITNLSAAATHYRMMRGAMKNVTQNDSENTASPPPLAHHIQKLSFTGEPIDSDTEAWAKYTFGRDVCSMYGTTEVGVILVSYPAAEDFEVKPGSLGKPVPGLEVAVVDHAGKPCQPAERGEIMVLRKDGWFPTKDLGYVDADGYFYHAGRADDVIISAGWTMSAVEIEDVLLKHPDIAEVAVVASPDKERGHIPKAFVVSSRAGDDSFRDEIIRLAKERLSQHEYPRAISFIDALPKLPAGKINRKQLRDAENERL